MHDTIYHNSISFGVAVVKLALPAAIPIALMAQQMITEATGMPLTIVAAVGGACWYINGRFTKIETKLDDLTKSFHDKKNK